MPSHAVLLTFSRPFGARFSLCNRPSLARDGLVKGGRWGKGRWVLGEFRQVSEKVQARFE